MAETVPTILLPVLLTRLVELLLRYDEAGFRRLFVAHPGTPAEDATLRPVRDLAALLYLRDELFEHILPRIVRRLSFSIPNQIHIEEPPTTGDINWERTLAATWEERPGETPLHLHTRARRNFATPANMLTVATLLEVQATAHRLLQSELLATGNAALRHPLAALAERCERALQFPQFAALRPLLRSCKMGRWRNWRRR
ncbi:MAG: hypothetical protein HC876_09085 [Chloroflexaceae bacterium]|nr:hypothetical protein [Chloroflexaceae bacterium]